MLPARIPSRVHIFVLVIVVVAYLLWILSLPCFPSTDGPVHLYYAKILGAFLSHSDSRYSHFFHVRHILPPYSLYYYLLVGLSKVVSMFAADKVIICLYIVLFVSGFHYLARAIGPRADVTTTMATLLVLNWPLGMGFVSFCLSLAISLWALGIWVRLLRNGRMGYRITFVCVTTLVMLSHPVPLLILLLLAAALLLTHAVSQRREVGWWELVKKRKEDVLTLAVASANVLYVRLFTTAHPLDQGGSVETKTLVHDILYRFGFYGRQHALTFLYGRQKDLLAYRFGLLFILVLPIVVTYLQRCMNRRERTWTFGDTFFLIGIGLLVFLPFLPSKLNDCFYFADRLTIYGWLMFLLATSGVSAGFLPRAASQSHHLLRKLSSWHAWATPLMTVFILCVTACFLHAADRLVRPAAVSITSMHEVPTGKETMGLVLEDARKPLGNVHNNVSWNPYYWALVNAFREHDVIMANAPWMDESIIPVAPSPTLPEVWISSLQEPVPSLLQRRLLRTPSDLLKTYQTVQFLMINTYDRPSTGDAPLVQVESARRDGWACTQADWYKFCSPHINVSQQQGGEVSTAPVIKPAQF